MTTKHLSNENPPPFDSFDFKSALIKEYGETIANFFMAEWRDLSKLCFELSERYAKLVEWCDKEIKQAALTINTFSPVDKDGNYTVDFLKTWREDLHYFSELVYFRALLLDNRTNNEQRKNIEYTICKLYGIHYNEYLGVFV